MEAAKNGDLLRLSFVSEWHVATKITLKNRTYPSSDIRFLVMPLSCIYTRWNMKKVKCINWQKHWYKLLEPINKYFKITTEWSSFAMITILGFETERSHLRRLWKGVWFKGDILYTQKWHDEECRKLFKCPHCNQLKEQKDILISIISWRLVWRRRKRDL